MGARDALKSPVGCNPAGERDSADLRRRLSFRTRRTAYGFWPSVRRAGHTTLVRTYVREAQPTNPRRAQLKRSLQRALVQPKVPSSAREIRDPIHVFVHVDENERRVLDSPPFQRLRNIHQLAMTYLIYPGASHKRFEHSLGVMHLV